MTRARGTVPGGRLRPPFANAFFFPAACLYGAGVVPWWILGLTGIAPAPRGLTTPAGHGHEMLFGYAFAVVAGYLLGPQPLRITLPLLAAWLCARVGFLVWPGSWLAIGTAAAFALGVAARVLPRFSQAKQWRNRTVAPVVTGFGVLAAVGSFTVGNGFARHVLLIALTALSVLLFFMGGRIIAPAVGGYLTRQGRQLEARVQPRLEGLVLVTLFGALTVLLVRGAVADAGLARWSELAAGTLLMLAGALTALRLLRWRLWHCKARIDLLLLGLGYGWLAVGLLLLGAGLIGTVPVNTALHALAVGALGTLTVVVMARTRLLYRFRDANRSPAAHAAALLMTGAALARLASAVPALHGVAEWMLGLSALCWSSALLILLAVLARTLRPQVPSLTSSP